MSQARLGLIPNEGQVTTFEENIKKTHAHTHNRGTKLETPHLIHMFMCSEAVTTDSQSLHVGFHVQIRRISAFSFSALTHIKDQLMFIEL